MEQVQYEGLMGITSEINKKSDAILANFKTKENQVINQEVIPPVSKEEMETIVKEKVAVIGNYIEMRLKQQTEQQTKILTAAIKVAENKIENLPKAESVSFDPILKLMPQTKKIAFFGFEFLRSSVVIFILSVAVLWSLVMNVKQMDNYRALKTRLYRQTEYILHLQQKDEKTEKEKVKKAK